MIAHLDTFKPKLAALEDTDKFNFFLLISPK